MLLAGIRFKQGGPVLLFLCRKNETAHRKDSPVHSLEHLRAAYFSVYFCRTQIESMFGVDGAFRCLEVYRRESLFFHENNPMPYSANILMWSRICRAVGREPSTPEVFLPWSVMGEYLRLAI